MSSLFSFSAAKTPVRGVFINTAPAQCSIYESGRMIQSCLKDSDAYSLDCYAVDEIDLPLMSNTGELRRLDRSSPEPAYDFWLFNWHFVTMAPFVDLECIARLRGLKFCILLELEPNNPLRYIGRDVFDGYLALDPSAAGTGKIFTFPRPLDGIPRSPRPPRKVPIISSFGFGTPGKGFELVVEAVNKEFDEAVVRVNIPVGDYTSDFDKIHGEDYARHLARTCRAVAKEGIDVRFSYDFMTPAALLDWCCDSDLNCFLYSRRQPGLSATTDQAIVSGQPLLTGTNDTFRHIHRYIPPYPLITLRQAMETTTPMVRRMQEDWSRSAFARTFERMLCAYGLAPSGVDAPPAMRPVPRSEIRPVLVATTRSVGPDTALEYENRLADCLGRSGTYRTSVACCHTEESLRERIEAIRPWAVIATARDNCPDWLKRPHLPVPGPFIRLEEPGTVPASPGSILPRRPIVPYYTVAEPCPQGLPIVWLLGYDCMASNLEDVLDRIQVEIGSAEIRIAQVAGGTMNPRRLEDLVVRHAPAGMRITFVPLPEGADDIVKTFAQSSFLIFYHDPDRSRSLEDYSSLALTGERPVVFTRTAPFPCFQGLGSYLEDQDLNALLKKGAVGQIPLVAEFGEWSTFAALEKIFAAALEQVEDNEAPPLAARLLPLLVPREKCPVSIDEWRALFALDFSELALMFHQSLIGRAMCQKRLDVLQGLQQTGRSVPSLLGELLFSEKGLVREASLPRLARRLATLLSLDDADFVPSAFAEVLERQPVEAELANGLAAMSMGLTRPALLGELFFSVEGMQSAVRAAANLPQESASRDEDATLTLQAAYFLVIGNMPASEALDNLRAQRAGGASMRALVGMLLLSDKDRPGVADLEHSQGAAFVQAAYRCLLGRDPDPQGAAAYASELAAGFPKEEMLGDILLSPEGLAYMQALRIAEHAATYSPVERRTPTPEPPALPISGPPIPPAAANPSASFGWLDLAVQNKELFVHAAYRMLLGRDPEPAALAGNVERMSRDVSKRTIVGEIMLSEEMLMSTSNAPALRNGLARLKDLGNAPFVEAVYRLFQGRTPDSVMLDAIAGQLETSLSRFDLVGELVLSAEGLGRLAKGLAGTQPPANPVPLREHVDERRIFLLAYAADTPDNGLDSACAKLAASLIGQGEIVRLLRWSPTAKKFLLLRRDQLASIGTTDPIQRCIVAHPACDDLPVCLETPFRTPGNWLLAPGPIRLAPQTEYLHEMDAILEAKRLGLATAFIFHGCDTFRLGNDDDAYAQELYMRALLLVDLVIPVASLAQNDLLAFFASYEGAEYVPFVYTLRIPLADARNDAWSHYTRRLRKLLGNVSSRTRWLDAIYCCLPPEDMAWSTDWIFAANLSKALNAMGVRLVPIRWDAVSNNLAPLGPSALPPWRQPDGQTIWSSWVTPDGPGAPQWVFVMPGVPATFLSGIVATCRAFGLKAATVASPHGDDLDRNIGEALTSFHRVLATSPAAFDRLWNFLLVWRGKLPLAEDRFLLVPAPTTQPGEAMSPRFEECAQDSPMRIAVATMCATSAELETLRQAAHQAFDGDAGAYQLLQLDDSKEDESATDLASLHPDFVVVPGEDALRCRIVTACAQSCIPCLIHGPAGREDIAGVQCADLASIATAAKAFRKLRQVQWRRCLSEEPAEAPRRSWQDYARDVVASLVAEQAAACRHVLDALPRRVLDISCTVAHPRPILSICISTYKRAEWAALNLRNLFAQIGQPSDEIEVLVVDNASPDHTPQAVSPFLERKDFRYVRNPANVGILGNLAVTAQRARGRYIWILGDDDLTRPGTIAEVLRIIETYPRIGLIYMNYGYSSVADATTINDLDDYLDHYNVLEPEKADVYGPVKLIAARTENFFTAIYSQVYRRDHALAAYCQDTSGRMFSTMAACVPTAKYVLSYMMEEPAYWIGRHAIVVNSNVSWADYGAMLELEHLPRCWDLAEWGGADPRAVDLRRANRLWLVEMSWRELFEHDTVGNAAYLNVVHTLTRLKHLPELDARIPTLRALYERAYKAGHRGAPISPDRLFAAFA